MVGAASIFFCPEWVLTATFLHHPHFGRFLGAVALGVFAVTLAACDQSAGPNLGATASSDNLPKIDFGARGPVPRGSYGTVTGDASARPEVFSGSPLPASASAFAAEAVTGPNS